MYPSLFRTVLFPALDVLNRSRVARVLAFLGRSQWFSSDELVELQDRKLSRILAWTRAHCQFYRQYWRTAPDARRTSSRFAELDGLPIVNKQELRQHLTDFPLRHRHGRSIEVKTSGSTGEPMTYYRSALQDSWFWALRIRMWEWAGYRPGQPYVTLNLNPRTAWRKRVQDILFRCYYHGFNANQHDVDTVLRDLRRKNVHILVGYASSLFLLSRALRQRGGDRLGIKGILSTGDTLFPSYRQHIEETFGSGVTDYYGAGGEGLHLASQCEARSHYHLHCENSVIELLTDGRPAAPGELGEIVVTQLDNYAMPLIRYSTQDVAIAAENDAACSCGRNLPLIKGVEGRVPDIVFAPDGSALVVHFFTILFEYLDGIQEFQIVQEVPDRIVARIVPAPGYNRSACEARVRNAVDEVTHGTLAVGFEYVDEIPLAPSGKRRFVVSNVSSELFAASEHDGREAVVLSAHGENRLQNKGRS